MERKKILLVRTDRLGDVTLTTPAVAALRAAEPRAEIRFLTSAYARGVLENNPALDGIITDENFFATLRELRRGRFDAAVIFFLNFRVALLALLAGIPLRVGPASKVWALLLNRRIRQRRSSVAKHEADYNLDLLAPLGVRPEPAAASIALTAPEKEAAARTLAALGLGPGDFIIGMHPGSSGSALNWPPGNFAALARSLLRNYDAKVLFTGSPAEARLLERVAAEVPEKTFVLREPLPLRHFIALIARCGLFVTNSTGPLHLAAAQGVATLSFFPPIKVCSPVRWGPYGGGLNRVLVPQGPACAACAGGKCPRYSCMAEITPEAAFREAAALLAALGRRQKAAA